MGWGKAETKIFVLIKKLNTICYAQDMVTTTVPSNQRIDVSLVFYIQLGTFNLVEICKTVQGCQKKMVWRVSLNSLDIIKGIH